MEFSKFVEWGFYGVISGGIFYLLSILKEMAGS